MFRKDSHFYEYDGVYQDFDDNYNKEELWIYINGILTDLESAKGNCKKMRELFGQPVKLLTQSYRWSCVRYYGMYDRETGLLKHGTTKPREELRNVLLKEMKNGNYKKIVLVAHSQGTIITGNVAADLSDAATNNVDDFSWFLQDSIWFDKGYDDKAARELKETLEKFEVYLLQVALIMWMVRM